MDRRDNPGYVQIAGTRLDMDKGGQKVHFWTCADNIDISGHGWTKGTLLDMGGQKGHLSQETQGAV